MAAAGGAGGAPLMNADFTLAECDLMLAIADQCDAHELPESSPLITSLNFANWRSRAGHRYMPRAEWAAILLPVASFSYEAAPHRFFTNASFLTHEMTLAALNLILSALVLESAFDGTYAHWQEWVKAVAHLRQNASFVTSVTLNDTHFQVTDAFTYPNPAAGGGGRGGRGGNGGGGGGGPARIPGPPELEFLHALTLGFMATSCDHPSTPLLPLAELIRFLGRSDIHASREDPGSRLRIAADLISRAIATYTHHPITTPSFTARRLPALLEAARLPRCLTSGSMDEREVEEELVDSLLHATGTETAIDLMAQRRLRHVGGEYEALGKIIDACSTPDERVDSLERLASALLPQRMHTLPLRRQLPDLDRALTDRVALIEQALGAGKSVAELVTSIVTEALESTGEGAGGSVLGAAGDGAGDAPSALKEASIRRALNDKGFLDLVAEVEALTDTTSGAARRDIIDRALSSGSIIVLRFFAAPTSDLRHRHPIFSVFEQAATELLSFFSWAQVVDDTTGTVAIADAVWFWDASELRHLLAGRFMQMEWCSDKKGWVAARNHVTAARFETPPRAEWYILESSLRGLRKFGHRTFTALGYSAEPAEGFSFATLVDYQLDFVEYAETFDGYERQELLTFAAAQFEGALEKAGTLYRACVFGAEPRDMGLDAFLPRGTDYERNLEARRDNTKPFALLRRAFPHLGGVSKPVPLPGATPSASSGRGGGSGAAPSGSALSPSPNSKPTPTDNSKRPPPPRGDNAPGSKSHIAVMLDSTHLLLAGRVYDIAAIAKHHHLQADSRCWPVLLSNKPGGDVLALCPLAGHADHQGLSAKMHLRPKNWDLKEIGSKFSVSATAAQRKAHPAAAGIGNTGGPRKAPRV